MGASTGRALMGDREIEIRDLERNRFRLIRDLALRSATFRNHTLRFQLTGKCWNTRRPPSKRALPTGRQPSRPHRSWVLRQIQYDLEQLLFTCQVRSGP
jgi:hypothetical protein